MAKVKGFKSGLSRYLVQQGRMSSKKKMRSFKRRARRRVAARRLARTMVRTGDEKKMKVLSHVYDAQSVLPDADEYTYYFGLSMW